MDTAGTRDTGRASRPRRILVTGGTGFIGSALVARLRAEGHQVTAMGRDPRRVVPLLGAHRSGGTARFLSADLRDRPAVVAACRDQEIVYHAGALTAPWGSRREFRAVNVAGTASVVLGCRVHGVERLIHVSSPSVVFALGDRFDLTDDTPYPRRAGSVYAETKRQAEVLVRRAMHGGLRAVIIRPRAVFGPGDTTLFPRLLRAARDGRLPRIGRGNTVTDLTYIDDAIHALILAMTAEQAVGHTITITDGQAVGLWPLIDRLLAAQGMRTSPRTLPLPAALAGAWALEWLWRLCRVPGEPPATRYSVALLGYSQTFDSSHARLALGYAPVVGLEEGLARSLAWLREVGSTRAASQAGTAEAGASEAPQRHSADGQGAGEVRARVIGERDDRVERPARTPSLVSCEVLAAGYCMQSAHLMVRGGARHPVAMPATFALIRHPRHGAILFDTGYAPRSLALTRRLPFSLYTRLLPIAIDPVWSAVTQLAAHGIAADAVRHVIISHFHADHLGGLRDFPAATVIATQGAHAHVRGRTEWRALRAAFVPGLLPDDLDTRLRLLPFTRGGEIERVAGTAWAETRTEPWSVFPETIDLFGDGSLRALPLPGHAAGQLGLLARVAPDRSILLAADGCWTSVSYRARRMPSPLTAPMQDSWVVARRTLHRLHAVWRSEPGVQIVPCHCPEQHGALLATMGVPAALRWRGM